MVVAKSATGTPASEMGLAPVVAFTGKGGGALGGFTTGCGCVAPALSQQMLSLARAGDWATAEALRQQFEPLENLRNAIHPVRVLHEAVTLSGVADTGEILPLLSGLHPGERTRVQEAAAALLARNAGAV